MWDVNSFSWSAALISTIGIFISVWIMQRYQALNQLQKLGFPVPKPHFIRGNLVHLRWAEDKNAVEKQKEWLDKYGNFVGYYFGVRPRIMIADLDAVKQILVKDINIFTNRPDVPRNQSSLVSLRDQRWKEIRHIVTPTFSSAKLKLLLPLMSECVDDMIGILTKNSESEFDIYDTYKGLTLDVISKCALALRLDCQGNPKHEILVAVRNFFLLDLSSVIVLLIYFPGLRILFRLLFRFAPANKLMVYLLGHLKTVVQQRRLLERPAVVDALQLLIEASEVEHKGVAPLTEDEIVWNALVFLLAGYETTSTALAYVSHCLTLHPDIQEKIFEELETNIDFDQELAYEDLSKLNYMELVILECLRLYPPVPLLVSRECKESVTIGNVTIPKGSTVDVPVWSIHRNPEWWPDPLKFDPNRHLPEMKAERHSMSYLPFGNGPRNCIGGRFAMLEMKLALAKMLSRFRLEPCQRTKEPLPTVIRSTIMTPAEGVWVKLVPRYHH